MTDFRNDPLYVILQDPRDLTPLGLTSDQSDMVVEAGWTIVNAPRPLDAIWVGEEGHYHTGLRWVTSSALNAWHFAAGDPEAQVHVGLPNRTMADVWNADDAYPLCILGPANLKVLVDHYLDERADDYGYSREEIEQMYRDTYGDDFTVSAAREFLPPFFDLR